MSGVTDTTSAGTTAPAEAEQVVEPTALTDSPTIDAPNVVLGLSRTDRRVVTVLVVISFGLMVAQWYRLTQHRPQALKILHPEGYRYQLDINAATWVEWMQLERIGETLARRIVADRDQRGPFESIDAVQRVDGIGPKTLAALRPHLICVECNPADASREAAQAREDR